MDYIEYKDDLSDKLLEVKEELSDKELKKIYKYHYYKGYYNIITLELVNFFSTVFMIFFILILVKCIDYNGVKNIDNNSNNYIWDFIDIKKIVENTFIDICFILVLALYLVLRIITLIEDVRNYYKIKVLLKEKININSYEITIIKWYDLIKRIKDKFNLNTYQIHSRILRVENIMINVLDSELNKFIFSKLMEWNLTYLIYNTVSKYFNTFDITVKNYNEESEFLNEYEKNEVIKKQKLHFNDKNEIKSKLEKNFLILAVITYLFMPFLFIYVFFFTFLKYGERYYNNPVKITYRHWSINSNWKLRYFNELGNNLDLRLDISSKYAKEYLDFNKSNFFKTIIKFIVLILSSLFFMLLLLSVYNEKILLNLNITKNKHVLWYLGILGSFIAIGRNIYKNNKIKNNDQDNSYKKLLIFNPLINNNIINKIRINDVNNISLNIISDNKKENKNKNKIIKKLYVYQIYTLFVECFSVLLVPFYLIYICNYLDSILERIEKSLYYDKEDLGFISKDSNFRILNKNSSHKSLLSFKEFRKNYPDWGKNIEIYQIGSLSFLNKPVSFNKKYDFPNSIFDETFNSDISIL